MAKHGSVSLRTLIALIILTSSCCFAAPDLYYKKTVPDTFGQVLRFGSEGLKTFRNLNLQSLFFNKDSTTTSTTTTTQDPKSFKKSQNDNFSTDDLFSGLSNLWDGENSLDTNENIQSKVKQPEVSVVQNSDQPNSNSSNSADGSEPYWKRMKIILGNMKSALQDINGEDTQGLDVVFESIDKIVGLGDNINLVEAIKESFDIELLEFLGMRWNNTKLQLVHNYPILNSIIGGQYNSDLVNTILYALIKKFSSTLQAQAFMHLDESDFIVNLMKSSGFKPDEIQEVFSLLDLPLNATEDNFDFADVEGRAYSDARYDYDFGRTGGYSSPQHGYDSGGGYMMMSTFDPFVLLAGLAFATFAAYIIYRLLSSTTGGRKKRSMTDFDDLALDLSDVPSILTNLYTWIGTTEKKYAIPQGQEMLSSETLSNQANELWMNFNEDRLSKACVKRYLCEKVQKSVHSLMDFSTTFHTMTLVSLASALGIEDSGKIVDELLTKVLDGDDLQCASRTSCDHLVYKDVLNKNKNMKSKLQ